LHQQRKNPKKNPVKLGMNNPHSMCRDNKKRTQKELEMNNNHTQNNFIRTAGLIAVFATMAVAFGDELSLYSPSGFDAVGYTHLHSISELRLKWGYFLGVFGLPFFILGFWHIYQGLKSAGTWLSLPVFLINTFVVVIGAVTHGQTALLALLLQAQEKVSGEAISVLAQTLDQFRSYYDPILLMMRVLTLITSIWFVIAVLSRRTRYPRWMAFFNPWSILIVLMVPGFISPNIGAYLTPPAFNIAHMLFFGISTILLWKE